MFTQTFNALMLIYSYLLFSDNFILLDQLEPQRVYLTKLKVSRMTSVRVDSLKVLESRSDRLPVCSQLQEFLCD